MHSGPLTPRSASQMAPRTFVAPPAANGRVPAHLPGGDVDLSKYHSGVAEFDARNQRRRLKHLAKFHSLGLDRPDQTVQRPYANLGDGQLRPETGGDGWRPATNSTASSAWAGGADFRGRQTPMPPRRALGSPAPPASPPAGAGYGAVPRPPPTGGSRLSTASTPPRTSSTTLSTLWRRALSTPALGTIDEASAAATMGTNRGKALGSRDDEDWWGATEAIPKEELVRLVEHVHAKVLGERRRRKDFERSRHGGSDAGSSHRSLTSRGSPG